VIASRYVNKCRASNQIRVNENGTMMMFRDDGCVERRLVGGDKTNITTRDRWIDPIIDANRETNNDIVTTPVKNIRRVPARVLREHVASSSRWVVK
jgi:hypothetical protein